VSRLALKPVPADALAAPSKGERTAGRILEASAKLFAAQGYAAVSMRQISAEVGIGQGALYNHFASKQDLLVQILLEHMQGLLAAWQTCDPGLASPRERLKAFVFFHIDHHRSRARDVFLSYMELRSLEPATRGPILAARKAYEAVLIDTLEAGRLAGDFQIEDAKLTAMALLGMLAGLTNWYQEGGRLGFEHIQHHYWLMTHRMVAATAPEQDGQGEPKHR
jgi:AcrR family transcriptional regulator